MLAATVSNQISGSVNESNNVQPVEIKTEITENTSNDSKDNAEKNTDQPVPKKTKTTKETVEEYFQDIPILVDVAYCESRFIQFNRDGSVHRGVANPADVGVMQINEKYHLETSEKLGLDIHTLEGNMAYGRFLYKTQGTAPWEYSSHCWNKSREVALN
jgi:hypothetical protein